MTTPTVPLTDSCVVLGCTTDGLVCHRCGGRAGAVECLIVPGPFSLAGAVPKLSMRSTHACDTCVEDWHRIVFNGVEVTT